MGPVPYHWYLLMQLEKELPRLESIKKSVVTVGVFDGVHRGHKHLLHILKERARRKGYNTGVLTFRNHPKAVFDKNFVPQYITSLDDRIQLIKEEGVDFVAAIPFTRETSIIKADTFTKLLKNKLHMKGLVIGPDFALGHKREGDLKKLIVLGKEMDFFVEEVPVMQDNDEAVRSTGVRESILSGKIESATRMLGRYFSINGVVEHGEKRGRELGFPTANLRISLEMIIPANGIYATIAHLGSEKDTRTHFSSTSIGTRPTFEGTDRSIEAYLLDFDADLYGQTIQLDFVRRLRDELKFDTVDALLLQMEQDVKNTRHYLSVI